MKKRIIEIIWCLLALICLTLTTSEKVGWWNIIGFAGFVIIAVAVIDRYKDVDRYNDDILEQTNN